MGEAKRRAYAKRSQPVLEQRLALRSAVREHGFIAQELAASTAAEAAGVNVLATATLRLTHVLLKTHPDHWDAVIGGMAEEAIELAVAALSGKA